MAAAFCLSRALPLAPRLSARLFPASLASSSQQARRQSGEARDPEQFLITKPGLKAKVIDGKKIAAAVKAEVAEEVGEARVTESARWAPL